MAYARLNADATEISITRSISYRKEFEYPDGCVEPYWKTGTKKLGTIAVTEPVSSVEALSKAEAAEIQTWLNIQLNEIHKAYARNAAKGVYGGKPVIKRSRQDDFDYRGHPDYIPGRKTGEFIGVIDSAKELGLYDASITSEQSDEEWIDQARGGIYELDIFELNRLLGSIDDHEFTDDEVAQIVVYSQAITKLISDLSDDRFRTKTSVRQGSDPDDVKRRKDVVESNIARNKAEMNRLMQSLQTA
ncbi:MAG: hypothetical protein GYB18_08485 [Oceanospirillales bacterium]|nr:hypothetical protein [Oceanospirillales bacterium]